MNYNIAIESFFQLRLGSGSYEVLALVLNPDYTDK